MGFQFMEYSSRTFAYLRYNEAPDVEYCLLNAFRKVHCNKRNLRCLPNNANIHSKQVYDFVKIQKSKNSQSFLTFNV